MSLKRTLSLVSKLEQENVQDRIKDIFLKKKKIGPWVIELDPTTACNLACHDCISANLLNQGGIDPERIKNLALEFKNIGVKAVVLIGGGEPMAHKEFGNLVKIFSENDIHTGVTTNGTLLNKHMEVCSNNCSWLRVSVDAGSEKIFQEFRPHASGKSQFNTVIKNMEEYAKNKKGKLGYSFLILSKYNQQGELISTNAVDIIKAANVAKDIGCDYFEVKPPFDIMHYLQKHSSEVIDITNDALKKISVMNNDNFEVIAPLTIDDAMKNISEQPKTYSDCMTASMRTVVSPSGVYVCPYHRGNLNMRIGDINNKSFNDVWFGEQRKQVMEKLDPKKHCGFHCIRDGSNKYLRELIDGKKEKKTTKNKEYDRFI